MKYSLVREKGKYANAGSKAVRDTNQIVYSFGYTPLPFDLICTNFISHNIRRLVMVIKIFFTIKKKDVCFMQWPTYSHADDFLMYYLLKVRCQHLQLLIHDLTSLRTTKNAEYEDRIINLAERIIVHTNPMKDLLVSRGVKKEKIRILTSFDYLVFDSIIPQRKLTREIVFAGNLEKSVFLSELKCHPIEILIFCYGKEIPGLSEPLIYKGQFDSDYVSGIEGSWGLVWDGDSIETCSGRLGEYLKINSPHKVSLYIVSRLPIIIWRNAALANYIEENGLGILIDSLEEIPSLLSNITSERYDSFLKNLDKERVNIIKGEHLRNCLID